MKKLSEDHYIVMDDSEPEIGGWVYSMDGIHQWFGQVLKTEPLPKKITHSTNIDWNEVYYIPLSEVKELLGVVDVEKKGEKKYPKSEFWVGSGPSRLYDENAKERRCYIEGYKEALEDNKEKKYTEEDLMKFYKYVKTHTVTEALRHIQPKTEWEVELVDGKLKLK